MTSPIGILSALIGNGLSMEKRLLNIALATVVVAMMTLAMNLLFGPPASLLGYWPSLGLFILLIGKFNKESLAAKAEREKDS